MPVPLLTVYFSSSERVPCLLHTSRNEGRAHLSFMRLMRVKAASLTWFSSFVRAMSVSFPLVASCSSRLIPNPSSCCAREGAHTHTIWSSYDIFSPAFRLSSCSSWPKIYSALPSCCLPALLGQDPIPPALVQDKTNERWTGIKGAHRIHVAGFPLIK
jgi:hypothetical protein